MNTVKFISHTLKQKNIEDKQEKNVEVSEKVLNQLNAVNYGSKRKKKALFMHYT